MNIIEYITKKKKITQKDLAEKLKVSTAQISKWKAGEYISFERNDTLMAIAELFGNDFEDAILFETEENLNDWINYFKSIHSNDVNGAWEFKDIPEDQTPMILHTLKQFGFSIPKTPPTNPKTSNQDKAYQALFEKFFDLFAGVNNWSLMLFSSEDAFEDELHDYRRDIDTNDIAFTVSSIHLSERLPEIVIDKIVFTQEQRNLESALLNSISNYCEQLRHLGGSMKYDYFSYLNKSPYEKSEAIDEYHCEDKYIIQNFYTQAEKDIIYKLNGIENQLNDIREV